MQLCTLVFIEIIDVIDGRHQKSCDLQSVTLVELHQLIQQRLAHRHTPSVGY